MKPSLVPRIQCDQGFCEPVSEVKQNISMIDFWKLTDTFIWLFYGYLDIFRISQKALNFDPRGLLRFVKLIPALCAPPPRIIDKYFNQQKYVLGW